MNNQSDIYGGFFIPRPLLKNFLKSVFPLLYIVTRNYKTLINNFPAYKKRLNNHRLPWAHIDNEKTYDSSNLVNKKYLAINNPSANIERFEKYLRSTRLCESNSMEIHALAKQLREESPSDKEFAQSAFQWVKNNKYLVFKPIGGAIQTFKTKGGVCLDQLSLLVAIARAGGIPARYRLYGLAPTQELYDVLVAPNPIIKETYETLGFLEAMHGEAEVKINGKWIHGDPTFSDKLSVGMGIPISELGKEPGWRVRVSESSDIRFEEFPILFRQLMIPLLFLLRNIVDNVNNSLDEIRFKGAEILENMDIDEYNRRVSKTFKPHWADSASKAAKVLRDISN